MRNLNVFFIHAQWLKDRERVLNDFQRITSKYEWTQFANVKIHLVTDYDPQTINADIISKTVSYEQITEDDTKFYNQFLKNLHVFQLSNSLKHYKALEIISRG